MLLSHRLAGRKVERAEDLRGRDYKQNKQKQQVVRANPWERRPKSPGISVERGKLQTKWKKRKESLEGFMGAALWKDQN